MAADDKSVCFNHDEMRALQDIVGDWLNEEIAVPPFEPQVSAVLEKLGLGGEAVTTEVGPTAYPKTQEALSAPWRSDYEAKSSK